MSLQGLFTCFYLMLPLQPRQAWGLTKVCAEAWLLVMAWWAANEEYSRAGEFGGSYYGAKAAVVFCAILLWDMLYNIEDTGHRQKVLRKHHAFTIPIFLRMSTVGYTCFYGSLVFFTQFGIVSEVFFDMSRLEENKLPRGSFAFMNLMILGHFWMVLLDVYVIYGNLMSGFFLEMAGAVAFTYFHCWVTLQLIARFRSLYYPPYPRGCDELPPPVREKAQQLGTAGEEYFWMNKQVKADPFAK